MALMLTTLVLASGGVQASDWINPGIGDWFVPGNWSDGVPTSTTEATIDNSGTAQVIGGNAVADFIIVGQSGTGTLDILNGGSVSNFNSSIGSAGSNGTVLVDGIGSSWTSNAALAIGLSGTGTLTIQNGGAVFSGASVLGNNPGSTGTVLVDNASWTNRATLFVGGAGIGTLTIQNGGTVSNSDGVIGSVAGSDGTVLVDGDGSSWINNGALFVGNGGTGTLTIQNSSVVSSVDGFIGEVGGSSGTVLVDADSRWTMTDDLYVGNGGTGALTIQNGGVVSNDFASIAQLAGSNGTVLVDGAGSSWTMTSALLVGGYGTGTLTVQNSGTVSSDIGVIGNAPEGTGTALVDDADWILSGQLDIGLSGTGTLTIQNGGVVSNTTGSIGYSFSANGTVLVDGDGSRWTNDNNLNVGKEGTGALTIRNGGDVFSDQGFIGELSGGHGTVLVDGDGSSWTNLTDLFVGAAGTGTLTIQDGGAVSNVIGFIGDLAGSNGTVLVDGAGSSWTNDDFLFVGDAGTGTLTIQNGGDVSSIFGLIGQQAGSNGTVLVDGAGSSWTNNGGLLVGEGGTGTLTIRNGGMAFNGRGVIGRAADSSGTVLVDGAGSSWTNDSSLTVGTAGTGALTIQNGGDVSSFLSGVIGEQAGSNGTVLVDGAGSSWTHNDDLFVGDAGTGTLTLNDGGTVSATGMVLAQDPGSVGTLNIGGGGVAGVLNTATVTGGSGDATVNFDHSDDISVATVFAGSLDFNKLGTGTLLLGGTSSYTGATQVQAGTLLVEGALGGTTTTVFDGATLGGTGTIAGDVIVNDGGTLAPGLSPGTLTVGSLMLADGAFLDYELGQAGIIGSGVNDLIEITGDLTLDGTLNITDAGGFGAGVYRLMNYGGSFTDSGLEIGELPSGFIAADLFVQTAFAGQVNLINTAGVTLNFWDGASGPTDDGIIQGGDGVWGGSDRYWTDVGGSVNGTWNQGFAIFGGAAGTVTVQGEQAFTGLQFLTDGYRLQAGTDGALRASGTTNLRVDPNVTATIATPIVGDAMLVKIDEGTLVLEGDFGYTGGVVINGGLLVGDTGNLLGNILNRAALEFAQDQDGTYAGSMTGEGTLTKSGDGTLTLTGSNSYTGGTTIEAGTLQIGDGGAGGSLVGDVAIDTDATLAFNRSDSFSSAGAFSGDGAFDKFGAGTLTLTGDNSAFAGQGTLSAGGLQVDGSLGGRLDILAGATLGGSGTVGSVDNAGIIAPNGTLTFTGNYTHLAGASYMVDIAPDGTSDLLDIAGSATLQGGGVQVIKVPGQYAGGTRYVIVDAEGGVVGSFDTLDQSLPFLNLALVYDANHVYLDVLRNNTAFASICVNFNQCQVGATIDGFDPFAPPTADLEAMVEQLTTLDTQGALAAFDRLSGEAHASLAGIMLEGHALYGQTVTRRLAERREALGADRLHGGGWVRAYGATSELDGDGNAHGADADLHGIAIGFDTWANEDWLVGASVNAMRLEADFRAGDRGEADANNVSLYASWQGARAYLDGVVSYAWWDNEVTRSIQVGEIDRTATSEYGSHRFATYLEGGWIFNLGEQQLLQPMLSVQYDTLASSAFAEQGAQDLSLIGRSDSVDRLTAGAGLRWSTAFKHGDWTLEPTAQARWLHGFGDEYAEFDVAFAGAPDQGYRVRGVSLPQDRGVFGIGLAARNSEHLDLFVDYDYQSGDGFKAHNLSAGLRYRW